MRPQQGNFGGKRRGRNRNNNGGGGGHNNHNKPQNILHRSFESTGPDVKVRGNAQHVYEKYLQLARDANSSGDRVMAESYLQHAEHYFRIIAAAQAAMSQQQREQHAANQHRHGNGGNGNGDGMTNENGQPMSSPEAIETREPEGATVEAIRQPQRQPMADEEQPMV